MIKQYFTCSIPVIIFCMFTGFIQKEPGIYQTTTGKIAFKSEAPLELIRASSASLAGVLDINKKNFAFKVTMRSFIGFNSPLQKEHFNENYVESDKFPEASFKGKVIEDIDLSKDGIYEIRAKGQFTIHGVTQERIIKSKVSVSNHSIQISSNFSVLLSDHNIPIPKVVYQKLANEIKIEITAILEER